MAKKDKSEEFPVAEAEISQAPEGVETPTSSISELTQVPVSPKPIRIINNSLQVQTVTLRAANGKMMEMTIPAKGNIPWDSTENLGADFDSKRRRGFISLSS